MHSRKKLEKTLGVSFLNMFFVSIVSPKYNWMDEYLSGWRSVSQTKRKPFSSAQENVKGHSPVHDIEKPKPKRH